MRRCVLLAAVFALTLLAAAPGAQAVTTYRGQWQCNDRGAVRSVPGAELELWGRGWEWLPVAVAGRRVAQSRTAEDGTFTFRSPSDPDKYFARVVMQDNRGLHVRPSIAFTDSYFDSSLLANDVPSQDFGGILSGGGAHSPACAIYSAFHDADSDYRAVVGAAPPFSALTIDLVTPLISVPVTVPGSVLLPFSYDLGSTPGLSTVAPHEYAHAFRYGLDGNLGHYLLDFASYDYTLVHPACARTNEGFAFNEGWAQYWSREITGQPDCPGVANTDYRYEGRVAAGLADLEARCAGGSRATMVGVLRANPGVIHSFGAFRDRLTCPAPAPAPVLPHASGPFQPVLGAGFVAAALRVQIHGLSKDISALNGRLPAAARAVRHAPPCLHVPCLRTLAAETRAPGLRGEIALVGLQRASLRGLLVPATRQRLGSESPNALSVDLTARSRTLSRAVARSGRSMLREILRGAAPVLRRDHSRTTRRFARQMRAELAQLGRAVHGGPLPPSFAAFVDLAGPPKHVPARSFPPYVPGFPAAPSPAPNPTATPSPTPTPDNRTATQLTLSCPSSSSGAKPVDISGNLSPTVAGATIHLSYSAPKAGQSTRNVTTDANGDYHDSFTPTSSETYTIQASWDGDSGHKPASSPACSVNVTP